MIGTNKTIFSVVALAVVLVQPGGTNAGVPTDQMRVTVDRVLAILKDPALRSTDAKEARRSELRKAIFPRFDFEEMAKRSLGAEWRRRTPAEQEQFVRLFTELLKDSYIDSIESYRGEKVIYRREFQDAITPMSALKSLTNKARTLPSITGSILRRVNGKSTT